MSAKYFIIPLFAMVGIAEADCGKNSGINGTWFATLNSNEVMWSCSLRINKNTVQSGYCFLPDPMKPRIEITPGSSHPRPIYPETVPLEEGRLQRNGCELDIILRYSNGMEHYLRGTLGSRMNLASGFYSATSSGTYAPPTGSFLMIR